MKSKKRDEVVVVMGSDSDWETMRKAVDTLKQFNIACSAQVMSAHRTPDKAARFSAEAARNGVKVIIAGAGSAAHLAGVLAAHTTLPVIGVPIKGGALDGLDALLSTVQMPSGIPVATVALGSAGPVNAALLAVQMLALSRPELARALRKHKTGLAAKVAAGNRRIQESLERDS